jgi:hypothetical protein
MEHHKRRLAAMARGDALAARAVIGKDGRVSVLDPAKIIDQQAGDDENNLRLTRAGSRRPSPTWRSARSLSSSTRPASASPSRRRHRQDRDLGRIESYPL